MDRRAAIREIQKSELAEDAAEIIASLQPSVRIYAKPVNAAIPVGTSRFGGLPDLPPGLEWPMWDAADYLAGQLAWCRERDTGDGTYHDTIRGIRNQIDQRVFPLAFLAQINLRDVVKLGEGTGLPQEGMLYFFYERVLRPWGFDPRMRGGWRVLYTPNGPWQRSSPPPSLPADLVASECRLVFASEVTLPSYMVTSEGTVYDVGEGMEYCELYEEVMGVGGESRNQLRGHPQEVQGQMEWETELVTNGIYCGDRSANKDPRAEALREHAADWRLLLQIDTDEDGPGWMWGDSGKLYYWIRRQDLAALNFEQVWCHLQCH